VKSSHVILFQAKNYGTSFLKCPYLISYWFKALGMISEKVALGGKYIVEYVSNG